MDPGIKELEDHNFEKATAIKDKQQYRASIITRNMIGKRLWSYFQKWEEETDHYKTTMQNKVKIKMTQNLKARFGSYFYHWKSEALNK